MNRHFARPYEGPTEVPRRAYGRLQSYEFDAQQQTATLHYDLISADWLDSQLPPLPRRHNLQGWYKSPARDWLMSNLANRKNPFDNAPLFRLVLTRNVHDLVSSGGLLNRFGAATAEATLEAAHEHWAEFRCMASTFPNAAPATLYPGLFAPPAQVYTRGKLISPRKHKRLRELHDLSFFPDILASEVETVMKSTVSTALAVYDVGQGNANGILEPGYNTPTMYYDLGAGIYANRDTTPVGLAFCFSNKPTIILSHWDTDHWAGAYACGATGNYLALKQKWIAPLQEPSPIHMAFAFDIWLSDGQIRIYDVPTGKIQTTQNASGHRLSYWRGNGTDNNGTGIVMEIQNMTAPGNPAWLLTGDCDYAFFPLAYQAKKYVAVVAPHHGADLKAGSPVPAPAKGYARLLYSYGPDNTHSGVSHPTVLGVNAHNLAGWRHGAAYCAKPGHSAPGLSVRATSLHSPHTKRGGIIVGWTGAPAIPGSPCGGDCTIMPVQN